MVFKKVTEILADYKDMDAGSVTPETSFIELELDSLDKVELIMSLESEFDIQIDASSPIETVQDLVSIIEGFLSEGKN